MSTTRVRIDVGGKVFATSLDTVTKEKAAGSHLSRIFEGAPIHTDEAGTKEYFIDRDPRSFGYILQWLRDERDVIVHNDSEKDRLNAECAWYGPFKGGNPTILTDHEYHNCKFIGCKGNEAAQAGCCVPPVGCTHTKPKFYSLQLGS